MRHRLYLTILFYLFVLMNPAVVQGFGAPDYLPDGPHPRIWLSTEMLAQLSTKQQIGDPDWLALESWCDLHLYDAAPTTKDYAWGDAGNGYRGSGYLVRLRNYALGYQVLKTVNPAKAKQYATYAVGLMNKMAAVFSAGEELDGISMIRMGAGSDITINSAEASVTGTVYQGSKNGYTARTFGLAFPLAYDWLYDEISPDDRTKFLRIMYRWMDWARGIRSPYNNGILINGIRYHEDKNGDCTGVNVCTTLTGIATKAYQNDQAGVNFQTDLAAMDALIGIATYGDSVDSKIYLSKFKNERWNSQIRPYLVNALYFKGGDSPEGMSYFSSWPSLITAIYAYSKASGDNLFAGLDWPKEVLNSYIHQTASNLTDVVGEGDWPGNSIRKTYEKFVIAPAYIVRRMYPEDPLGAVAQDYIDKAKFSLSDYPANRLLWKETKTAAPLSQLPLSNVAIGTGLAVMRSSWLNLPDTNFASIQLGQGWRMSHQSYNQGNILIQRGQDWLLSRNVADTSTVGHNTLVFNGKQQYAMNPVPATPPIRAYVEGGNFFYIKGDLRNAHQRQYNPDLCLLFLRELVFVRPNFYIIKDTTRSNITQGTLKEWYSQYLAEPSISNATISAVVGDSKIYVTTITPVGGGYTKTTPSSGHYRVKYVPPVAQEYDQFLHLVETTASNTLPTDYMKVVSAEGTMAGVYIGEVNEPFVVMFSSDKDGNSVSGSVTYTLPNALGKSPFHIIANLVPATEYTFVRPMDKNSPQTYQVLQGSLPGKGKIFRSTNEGILHVPSAPMAPTGGAGHWKLN